MSVSRGDDRQSSSFLDLPSGTTREPRSRNANGSPARAANSSARASSRLLSPNPGAAAHLAEPSP